MRNLRKEYLHAQEEVKRIQSIPLVIGQFMEAIDQFTAIVQSTTGQTSYVRVGLSILQFLKIAITFKTQIILMEHVV